MDVFERDGGATTADTVHTREEFRQIVADVQELPETQRTALLLREIDALSYEQIAEAMDTTVPSVKSLLVRARVSLAEAAEARLLTCGEVRLELGQVAEGLARTSAPVRRHLRTCERCKIFRRELRHTGRALAAVYPVGGLVVIKKFILAKLGAAGGGAAASAAGGGAAAGGAAAGSGAAVAGAGAMAGSATAGGVISAGVGAVATKAAAGLAAAAIVTAGAVEVKHASHPARPAVARASVAQVQPVEAPQAVAAQPQQVSVSHKAHHAAKHNAAVAPKKVDAQPAPAPTTTAPVAPTPAPVQTDQGGSTVTLPQQGATGPTGTDSDPTAIGGTPQPSGAQPTPTTPTDPTQPTPTSTDPSSVPPPPPSDGDPSSGDPSQTQTQQSPPPPPPGQ
jgi:hypothetical protein